MKVYFCNYQLHRNYKTQGICCSAFLPIASMLILNLIWPAWFDLPSGLCAVGDHLEAGSVADKLIQRGHNLGEFGPQVSLFYPAVQHELVQCCGAVHGWGESIVLLHGIYHLRKDEREITITSNHQVWRRGRTSYTGEMGRWKEQVREDRREMNEGDDREVRDKQKRIALGNRKK